MVYDIRATIEGYGDVEISHRDLDEAIERYLPNSIAYLREEVANAVSKSVPIESVSEALLILAFFIRLVGPV